MKYFKAIGMMSGTSLDGIDAAMIETDGEGHIRRCGFLSHPYEDGLRNRLRACLNRPDAEGVPAVAQEMTRSHAAIVKALLDRCGVAAREVDVVGFHGQTIAHDPSRRYTCQIGDGMLLAQLTGIPVVNDFRAADVAAGGQGAPLAPVYHRALAAGREKPVVFLNIGGVANVTFIGQDGDIAAFDTGPGNAMIDDWMLLHAGKKYDEGGVVAASGNVDVRALETLMDHAYFMKSPPKSIDRDEFSAVPCRSLTLADGAATLTAFTVESIAAALSHFPETPREWIVSGGGRLNKTIMSGLREKVGVPVRAIEEAGYDGDAVEAEAFAYMAVRSLRGLPISFPATTGVPQPMTGGRLNRLSDVA